MCQKRLGVAIITINIQKKETSRLNFDPEKVANESLDSNLSIQILRI